MQELIDRVEHALEAANTRTTKLTNQVMAISGMTTDPVRIFLNELCSASDVHYLEIGVHQGATLCAALFNNQPVSAIAIDNFSQKFSSNNPEEQFKKNVKDNNIQVTFINGDCFNLTDDQKAQIQNVNVYFYDGDHRTQDQKAALTYYKDMMTDVVIYIADDYKHYTVPVGTKEGIEEAGFEVVKEWVITGNYHNGLGIFVLKKKN